MSKHSESADGPNELDNKNIGFDKRSVSELQRRLAELEEREKHLEELVENRTAELHAVEAVNQAKSEFLANMSHELRTPLTTILGCASLLMDLGASPGDRNNHLKAIHRSGERLLELINDILDISQIEAQKQPLEMQPCRVASLLADVASVLRPRAKHKDILLSVECSGEFPETIQTDAAKLRQAVTHLVSNAIKFTKQGSVRIVASFPPGGLEGIPVVKIEVIDTGIGIREEVLQQLLQPYSQENTLILREFGSTGLGLAISHQLVKMLGGDLTVKSVSGDGNSFTLTVPTGNIQDVKMSYYSVAEEREAASTAFAATKVDLSGVRLLLAEDGFDNRMLISTILQKAGATVETAENGVIAVAMAESADFDMILMDINMPEMNGYEATRLLRDHNYAKPILALTANAMPDDQYLCLAAGCDEYLMKPINRTLLLQTIAAYVGRKAMKSSI